MTFTAVNMRKVIIGIAATTMLGCSGGSNSSPKFLSVGTAPPGGAFFVVGGAIAQVVDENTKTAGPYFVDVHESCNEYIQNNSTPIPHRI